MGLDMVLMTCNWCQNDTRIPKSEVIVATDDSDSFMVHGKCRCGANVNTIVRSEPVKLQALTKVGVGIYRRSISMQEYVDTFCAEMDLVEDLSERCHNEVYSPS